MNVYKPKKGHAKQPAGSSDLEEFFVWALKLCRDEDSDRVVVETPDFRVTWDARKARALAKKRTRRATQPSKSGST